MEEAGGGWRSRHFEEMCRAGGRTPVICPRDKEKQAAAVLGPQVCGSADSRLSPACALSCHGQPPRESEGCRQAQRSTCSSQAGVSPASAKLGSQPSIVRVAMAGTGEGGQGGADLLARTPL